MPTFKLDGKDIPFEQGDTIIRAAYRQGIEIPHYCWHPGLSVAANCRMCLVEIEPGPNQRPMMLDVLRWDPEKKDYVPDRKPKLQPACQVVVTEGMVVKSETSPHVAEARAHVQEYLLLNHPVDCPICDQAGECKLQDYYMSQQRTPKRMRDEPVHKPKAVIFGPTIVYDAERCIACTRCIRFCDEILGDHMLDMRERGNLFEIVVAPGRRLEGKYTMMTEVVCPVGALTTRYWRHKGRVWLLKSTPTVCPGCATGCNLWIDVDPREQTAFRHRPRENLEVNRYWACDDGMVTYLTVHKDRVLHASIGRGSQARQVSLSEAIDRAANDLAKAGKRLAVVLSATASTEDNFVLAEWARAVGATMYLSGRPPWDGDNILRHQDNNPNRAGALLAAGVESLPGLSKLAEEANQYDAILALGSAADVDASTVSRLEQVGTFVLLATNTGPLCSVATITLPVSSWAETDGTFVNAKGMAQMYRQALRPKGDSAPAWDIVARVGRAMHLDLAYKRLNEVRNALVARTGIVFLTGKTKDESVDERTRTPRAGV